SAQTDFKSNMNLIFTGLQSFFVSNSKVYANTTDTGLAAPQNYEELLSQWQNFKSEPNAGQAINLIVAPYSRVEGFPISTPLTEPSSEAHLRVLAYSLWDLDVLINEAAAIIARPYQYAMGTTQAKRDTRIQHVKSLLTRWQAAFDDLKAVAQNCLKTYSKEC